MGRYLRTRFSLLQPDQERTVANKQALQKSAHDCRARSRDWIVGDRVMARNLHPGPDWVPSTILEVLGPVTYLVETEEGQRWKRHADQLKDWLSSAPHTASENSSEDAFEPVTNDEPNVGPGEDAEPESDEPAEPEVEEPESPEPSSPETVMPRYPQRNRRQPDRYS